MGLDCFWYEQNRTERANVDGDFSLCGGMLSGVGNDSFRGKVYNDLVELATGVSLYQEWIDNETISAMADALEAFDFSIYTEDATCTWQIRPEEFQDLKTIFRIHADAGNVLHGWW